MPRCKALKRTRYYTVAGRLGHEKIFGGIVMKKQVLVLLAVIFICPTLALASPGRLDAFGGHYDNKAGGYNVEKGPLAGKHYADKVEMLKELQKVKPGSVSADDMAKAEKKLAKRTAKAGGPAAAPAAKTMPAPASMPAPAAKVEKPAPAPMPAPAAKVEKKEEKAAAKVEKKAEEKTEKKVDEQKTAAEKKAEKKAEKAAKKAEKKAEKAAPAPATPPAAQPKKP